VIGTLVAVMDFWPKGRPLDTDGREELRSLVRTSFEDGMRSSEDRRAADELIVLREWPADEAYAFINEIEPPIQQAMGHLRLGVASLQEGRLGPARQEFLRATALDPENATAWLNLGAAHQELGMTSEAEGALGRSLALKPGSWPALFNLSACLASQGRTSAALDHLGRALDALARAEPAGSARQAVLADLKANRDFDSLRDNPRFHNLLGHPALTSPGAAVERVER
jgi:Flp pilus assembly protein TadD